MVRWRKWDGGAHWAHQCVYLGADRFGDWFGQPVGWRSARPGRWFDAEGPYVTLLPPSGDFAMTVNRGHPRIRMYVDLAWDVRWDGAAPTGIDMDLDVVLAHDGRGLFIDDHDEWDRHRVEFGYPDDVQRHLEALAVRIRDAIEARTAPFDQVAADGWLDRVEALDLAAIGTPPRLDG